MISAYLGRGMSSNFSTKFTSQQLHVHYIASVLNRHITTVVVTVLVMFLLRNVIGCHASHDFLFLHILWVWDEYISSQSEVLL